MDAAEYFHQKQQHQQEVHGTIDPEPGLRVTGWTTPVQFSSPRRGLYHLVEPGTLSKQDSCPDGIVDDDMHQQIVSEDWTVLVVCWSLSYGSRLRTQALVLDRNGDEHSRLGILQTKWTLGALVKTESDANQGYMADIDRCFSRTCVLLV
jgi:hypothetical protein